MRHRLLQRHLFFLLFVLGSVLVFWTPLRKLISFSLTDDHGSHIVLVAPASAYLTYLRRRDVFSKVRLDGVVGSSCFLAAAAVGWTAHFYSRFTGDYLAVEILALIAIWISAFILCYGRPAFRTARFPLLFLALMIPIPNLLLEKVIFFLQTGSAAVAYWLFRILAVPVFKEQFLFFLPRLNIEVAKECSGIRSSVVLLITTLLLGEFVLRSFWRKSLLVLSALPILILKNGVRIVTICLLTMYVDPAFLHGRLHTSGGIVFYMLGLFSLLPIIIVLKKGEIRSIKVTDSRLPEALARPREHELRIAELVDADR